MFPLMFIIVLIVASLILRRRGWHRHAIVADVLDIALLTWSCRDLFTIRDLLDGGMLIVGASGSGKSSGSGKAIGRAVVRYPKSGGLIVAAKPEDYVFWKHLFKEAGRADDLIAFEPGGEWRLNFFDYLHAIDADARTTIKFILMLGESISSARSGGGDDSRFFSEQNERWLYNAIVPLKLALGKVSAPDIHKFFATAPTSVAQLSDDAWQRGFHNRVMRAAYDKCPRGSSEAKDYALIGEEWFVNWAEMADKTRTSIAAGIMGIIHPSTTGVVRELTSGETNCSPLDMFKGKFILCNMPPSKYGVPGTFIGAGWRLLTQFTVLQREAGPDDCINVIFLDEFQQSVNSFDAEYLAQCRSHLGCMVCLTQSVHAIYAAMKNDPGNHRANALLTNFKHKVFHSVGDAETAEYASDLVGKSLQTFVGGSMSPVEDVFGAMMGRSQVTGSFSQHFEAVLQPSVFMHGLRTGGKRNDYLCDAFVIRSGETFSGGANWIKVAFSQG